MYGGEGSNQTKARIILESILILVYRNSHANIERNFVLSGLTTAHAEKDMTATFMAILEQIKEDGPNEYRAGRPGKYVVPNVLADGAAIIQSEAGVRKGASRPEDDGEGDEEEDGMEDAGAEEELDVELTAEDLSIDGDI